MRALLHLRLSLSGEVEIFHSELDGEVSELALEFAHSSAFCQPVCGIWVMQRMVVDARFDEV